MANVPGAARALGRRRLEQPRREVPRLGEEEGADLGDVGARGDVDEVVLALGGEGVRCGRSRGGRRRPPRSPTGSRVAERDAAGVGLRRGAADVLDDERRELGVGGLVEQLEAVDDEILVLAERHGRAPAVPAVGARPRSSWVPSMPRTTTGFGGHSGGSTGDSPPDKPPAPDRGIRGRSRAGTLREVRPGIMEKNYKVLATDSGVPIKAWTVGVPFEEGAERQLRNLAALPFIHKWVAVMPDVHQGMGATVGSVVATSGAIIPAAVGVDIGCGMMALAHQPARGGPAGQPRFASARRSRRACRTAAPTTAGRTIAARGTTCRRR